MTMDNRDPVRSLEEDCDLIRPLDGLHIGMLTTTELSALSRLVVAGLADRDYSGPGGMLGLGKVVFKEKTEDQRPRADPPKEPPPIKETR
jgi:hypothetical protein